VKKRILLISNNICSVPYPVFPLGIGHIASALAKTSYTVKIFDVLGSQSDVENTVRGFKPHVIGISQRNIDDLRISDCREFAGDVVTLVKKIRSLTDATVVLGGSGYSLFPKDLLERSGADFGIQGEGEIAFAQLLTAIFQKSEISGIAGLVYRSGRSIVANKKKTISPEEVQPAAVPSDLARWYVARSSMLSIQTQRGCPFTCCYCTYPVIEGKKARYRDPRAIASELMRAKKKGCGYFFIVDSVFNTSASHVARFCEEIISCKLNVSWGCFLRPHGLSQSLFGLMARAGCRHIEFGSDSFCDSVLRAYGKHFTFEDIRRASELAVGSGIHCAHFLIIGGPGESEKTMLTSFENSKKLTRTVIFPFVGMRIYPETKLYGIALEEGMLPRKAGLLRPRFYVTPDMSRRAISSLLQRFRGQRPNWIIGDIPASLLQVMNGLRQRGVKGPLWEFLAR
jgi:radical SAM superfamily enzyme YgiQ (UPF0313 family)